ncbi:MAG: MerR family transcriptional regulator [Actinobacteria bacterium]|nr:MerR family transcriptional regulator [Actinomycetota bacterium]
MRITEAARRLGMSPRMLRYRDDLGLLPGVRPAPARGLAGPGHRRFTEADLAAVSLALDIERRYGISPAALAFGLRVLTEPGVRADVAELGRRAGRIPAPPARALEFEKERALRLLGLGPRGQPPRQRGPARRGAAGR